MNFTNLLRLLVFYLIITIAPAISSQENGKYIKYFSGTSFFITDNGVLATADHVVNDATQIIIFYKGKYYKAKVLARDSEHDVALIKINVKGNNYFRLKESSPNKFVMVIGWPWNKEDKDILTETEGYTSDKIIIKGSEYTTLLNIEGDNIACEGNSGSPVINEDGSVGSVLTAIGVNDDKTYCSDVGYSRSIDYLETLMFISGSYPSEISLPKFSLNKPNSFEEIQKENLVPLVIVFKDKGVK